MESPGWVPFRLKIAGQGNTIVNLANIQEVLPVDRNRVLLIMVNGERKIAEGSAFREWEDDSFLCMDA